MRILLLLLPLVLLAARMQVEWSWFQQFQLEGVLPVSYTHLTLPTSDLE